jgi:hypothetical protein
MGNTSSEAIGQTLTRERFLEDKTRMTVNGIRYRVGNHEHPFHETYLKGGHEAVYIAMGLVNPKRRAADIRAATLAMYNSCREGYVYLIANPAWPEWVKCGMAVDADDRCSNYNTGTPYRDYEVVYKLFSQDRFAKEKEAHALLEKWATDRRGEWFEIDLFDAIDVLESLR